MIQTISFPKKNFIQILVTLTISLFLFSSCGSDSGSSENSPGAQSTDIAVIENFLDSTKVKIPGNYHSGSSSTNTVKNISAESERIFASGFNLMSRTLEQSLETKFNMIYMTYMLDSKIKSIISNPNCYVTPGCTFELIYTGAIERALKKAAEEHGIEFPFFDKIGNKYKFSDAVIEKLDDGYKMTVGNFNDENHVFLFEWDDNKTRFSFKGEYSDTSIFSFNIVKDASSEDIYDTEAVMFVPETDEYSSYEITLSVRIDIAKNLGVINSASRKSDSTNNLEIEFNGELALNGGFIIIQTDDGKYKETFNSEGIFIKAEFQTVDSSDWANIPVENLNNYCYYNCSTSN